MTGFLNGKNVFIGNLSLTFDRGLTEAMCGALDKTVVSY